MPKLLDLPLGTRFRLPECGKTGILTALGSSGARVAYDGAAREVEIEVEEGSAKETVRFTAHGKAVLISDETEVVVI
jgi:hypothetical protein